MPKVSVIIPVYGVEKYIERCARSLFEQTLEDIEFIFVDDCTTDKSIDILCHVLLDYPDRKEQVHIVKHEINKGLPQARKTGLKYATGEYIAHCDSDDWIDTNLYKDMYVIAFKSNLDVVICDIVLDDGKNQKYKTQVRSNDSSKLIIDMMYQRMSWAIWNKLFKRNVYEKDIIFPSSTMGEDMALVLQLLLNCKTIGFSELHYYYRKNPTSIINSQDYENIFKKYCQIKDNISILATAYRRRGLITKFKSGMNYLEYSGKKILLPLLGNHQMFSVWKNDYKGCEIKVLFDRKASFKERLKCFLSILYLYPLPRNKYQNGDI